MESMKPENVLGFLAWLDAMERIDTLLLEIRHVQVNIIHALREPVLYRILRFEEFYLWGEYYRKLPSNRKICNKTEYLGGVRFSWITLFGNMQYDLKECSDQWAPEFPNHNRFQNFDSKKTNGEFSPIVDHNIREDILHKVAERVEKVWVGGSDKGVWSHDQKRYYYYLRTLQDLKRNLLFHKLTLTRWGAVTFNLCNEFSNRSLGKNGSKIARFMVVRSGIIAKIREAVERLGDLQSQFEKALDTGQQEHPRPSLSRRREQGIYTGFLSDQTRDLLRQIHMMLNDPNPTDSADSTFTDKVVHGWRHDFTSRSATYHDEVTDVRNSTAFINTSYWMPERPDLQSVIAHEVAHVFLKERYDDCSTAGLSDQKDPFARLLRLLSHAMYSFGLDKQEKGPHGRHHINHLLKEISADLIAAAVEGHAYLHALFLEIVGGGLEVLFDSPGGRYDLDLAHNLLENGGHFDNDREWYIRLKLLCSWMRVIHHKDKASSLENLLVDGIETVIDDMVIYLDETKLTNNQSASYWRVLANRMETIIKRSDSSVRIKEWRKQRSRDYRDDLNNENERTGVWLYPRFTWRIDHRVRNHLFKRFIERKEEPNTRYSNSKKIEKWERIDESYLSYKNPESEYSGPEIAERPLFQHIYDIPWQCALMKGIDFTYKNNAISAEDWLEQMHLNTSLGREFYQLTLEFKYLTSRTGYHFVMLIMQQISLMLKQHACRHILVDILSEWCGDIHSEPNSSSTVEKLYCEINALYDKFMWKDLYNNKSNRTSFREERKKFICDGKRKISARLLINLYHFHDARRKGMDAMKFEFMKRIIEKILSQKVEMLKRDLHNEGVVDKLTPDSKLSWLVPLETIFNIAGTASNKANSRGTLSGSGAQKHDSNPEIRGGFEYQDDIIELLLDGFDLSANPKKDGERISYYYNINRISTAGSYDVDNGIQLQKLFSDMKRVKNDGSKGNCRKLGNTHCGKFKKFYIWHVLGRYDFITVAPTRPMSRCSIPHFVSTNYEGGDSVLSDNDFDYSSVVVNEFFPSFFIRREMGIPVCVSHERSWDSELGDCSEYVAAISVALSRRGDRLDFLYRLLRAYKRDKLEGLPELITNDGGSSLDHLKYIEQLTKKDLGGKDKIFLSEGWGDIIILFSLGDSQIDGRIKNIYQIQRILYEDYLVDRTEIILMPQALDAVMNSPDFNVSIQYRLLEDRDFGNSDKHFEKQAFMHLETSKIAKNCVPDLENENDLSTYISICRTPGRTDYTMQLRGLDTIKCGKDKLTYEDLLDLMLIKGVDIDLIQTNVGLRINKSDEH